MFLPSSFTAHPPGLLLCRRHTALVLEVCGGAAGHVQVGVNHLIHQLLQGGLLGVPAQLCLGLGGVTKQQIHLQTLMHLASVSWPGPHGQHSTYILPYADRLRAIATCLGI